MTPGAGAEDGRSQGAEIVGTVRELLPSALVRVELDGEHLVTAHMSGEPSRNFVRLLVGDRVRVVLAAGDRTRGRVVGKL